MRHVLQNLVLPFGDDRDLGRLYLAAEPGVAELRGRSELRVSAGATASFATYFNAFPAAYWSRSTDLVEVRLTVRTTAPGTLRVHRSNRDGDTAIVDERAIVSGSVSVDLPLGEAGSTGWLWFDLIAGEHDATLTAATWDTDREPHRPPTASVGITTIDKPDWCVRTLRALGDAEELDEIVPRVLIVDQGSRLVVDDPGYRAAAARLGSRMSVLRQENLGGSGGFARVMAESVARAEAEFVLLLDDDVRVEPEAIRRAVMFAAYCSRETIVGGHMLDLLSPTKLYAWAEVVDEKPFMWHPLNEDRMPVDFADADLRDIPLLHRAEQADYNGWWMCLIPRRTIERIGYPLPAFIKWDDAEYGLRARENGIATVSLPGAALWHVAWVGKDDQIDWQAYFHARNRIVTALLHSSAPRGGTLIEHSRRVDLKHFMAMQYYPVAIRHLALRSVLAGPDHMHSELAVILPRLREMAREFPETQATTGTFRATRTDRWEADSPAPSGIRLAATMTSSLVFGWFRRPRSAPAQSAEVHVPASEAKWWRLAAFDSAIVTLAQTGVERRYLRDRSRFRRQVVDSFRLHRALRREWSGLQAAYRNAPLTTRESWAATLAGAAPTEIADSGPAAGA
ncbi:glycosyltransferase [Microbacterium sp. SSM24]|uniref:glycosyltransferase n=1 Tax=Microbacterium sp. SSM24 TaxID=2991714 RepID=UPI0022265A1F|nr:glycosyltransferase [Microbacterium sp. SSM24]MCW3493755.1 glycosyltransferase [Microbacterium sp. SSM24]